MVLNLIRRYAQKYHILLLAAICSILFFVSSYVYVKILGNPPSGDEPHFLVISQTLLKYHSLNVMLDYQHGDYRLFYPIAIAPHVSYSASGQLLPLHSIGGPILWLIPYYFLGRLGAVFFISCVSVLTIVNIYKFLLIMRVGQKYALMVSLAYAVASPLFIYSHLTFIEPIGAFICIYVLRKIFQDEIKVSDLIISSVLLGILPWVHIRFAFFEMVLFFALLYKIYVTIHVPDSFLLRWRTRKEGDKLGTPQTPAGGLRPPALPAKQLQDMKYYLYYILPVTILFIAFEIYNYKVWGSLNPTINEVNDIHGGSRPFVAVPFKGILGVFFDQEFGLFVNFPIFILLLPGIVLAIRRKFLGYNLLMLILSIPYILVITSFESWSGGWGPAARFILVLLPLYSFYLAYTLEQINNILATVIFGIAVLYGIIYDILSAMPILRGFNSGTGRSHPLEQVRLFNHQVTDFLPSLFLPNQTRLFVIWIGLCVCLSVIIIGVSGRHAVKRGASGH